MKIYLDTCCWSRPYDAHVDAEVYAEATAVLHITGMARPYGHIIYGSLAVEDEMSANRNENKRSQTVDFYNKTVMARADYEENMFNHVEPLARHAGVQGYDVFHLCYAVAAGVDYLLTTDKKFLKAAAKLRLPTLVINPLNFNAGVAI